MRRFFGGVMLAVGLLLAGASGLCSLVILGGSLTNPGPDFLAGMGVVLLVGGIPFAIGLGLVFVGRRLLRKPDDSPHDFS